MIKFHRGEANLPSLGRAAAVAGCPKGAITGGGGGGGGGWMNMRERTEWGCLGVGLLAPRTMCFPPD